MAGLRDWQQLPIAGTVRPEGAARPITGSWRTGERPVTDVSACVNCLLCWLYCPDSAILVEDRAFTGVDLDYCKGCAICAEVCPTGAIVMVPE
jgi:2-oxoacid:acceptor oxidoreductase delta subunit (pyruvate/2-ketoisovalerate family)